MCSSDRPDPQSEGSLSKARTGGRVLRTPLWTAVICTLICTIAVLWAIQSTLGTRPSTPVATYVPNAQTYPGVQSEPQAPPQQGANPYGRAPAKAPTGVRLAPSPTATDATHYAGETKARAADTSGIQVSGSSLRHVTDRHTAGGTMTAGKSVFNSGEDVGALIRNAASASPTQEPNGRLCRVVNAGRNIGVDRATGAQTSTYTVITTESGQLVTAFPGLP